MRHPTELAAVRSPRAGAAAAALGAGLALAVPAPAPARCVDYPFPFCDTVAFCVRTDTHASSGTPDDPGLEIAGDAVPVSVTQTAQDASTALAEALGAATATVGVLSVVAETSVVGTSQEDGSSAAAFPFALLRVDDLVFSGPEPTVSTRLRLALDGTLDTDAANVDADANVSANASVTVAGNVCDASGAALHGFDGAYGLLSLHNADDAPAGTVQPNAGILAELALPATLVTGPFEVPTGAPLQLELWMTLASGALVGKTSGGSDAPTGSAVATADFGETLRLPDPGPVFELPAGFTVNSAQAAIANNRLPEPAAAAGAAAAIAALLARARLRRHRPR
jgi:hypothetical protein